MNTASPGGAFRDELPQFSRDELPQFSRDEPAPEQTHGAFFPADTLPRSSASAPRLHLLGGLLADLEADAQRRHDAKQSGAALGAVSGFLSLDERLGGSWAIGTHALHGSPGVGKTAFALQVAACCGCPALFVSCEMLPVELLRRHTARVTGTFLGKFKDGSLTSGAIVDHALKAVAAAPMLGILDGTGAPVSPADILQAAVTVRRLGANGSAISPAPENPHLLIVIDSLHTWADGYGAGEEYDRLNAALVALKGVAVAERAAVVYVSERNRASMGKGGQNSGAGSRKIEYNAESVIGLNATQTDDEGCPVYDVNGETEVKLTFGKNRHGEAGKALRLLFSGRCQRFREVAF